MAKKDKYEIDEICAYCELAEKLNDAEKMLCNHNGVVAADYRCKRFCYDPLKRNPSPPVNIQGLDPDILI